ncbi:hypothetical protein GUITHDRAFT_131788 [Guillardia theta CCMP2712]|uniref:PDZ domain-containing protein n=1 Tax=Guillardia theta (strain CCMP2712) TaxID=905079 RepID=L1K2I9_GUITC|nr:hypothetical protein GUITHDRAFT_131788 [Guillardia theta CCMP2712]EKX54777.1 hypothetical protein GUITHDRAFT_131788 [Guillardia theta CCMP2712]|eukprot:XP_005841757.1 hypothetical protein GUITHDRAFT_131788 [Guillardia theta CCMP2712]
MQVEIVSAELAPDGGPSPDVRCSLTQRVGNTTPNIMSTSVIKSTWNPVWKQTLSLEADPDHVIELSLWDESSSPSCCLGEATIPCDELNISNYDSPVRSIPVLQELEGKNRIVGTVNLRSRKASKRESTNPPNIRDIRTPDLLKSVERSATQEEENKTEVARREDKSRRSQSNRPVSYDADSRPTEAGRAGQGNGATRVLQLVRAASRDSNLNDCDVGLVLQRSHDGSYLVSSSITGSPAARAMKEGLLKKGDVLVTINRRSLNSRSHYEVMKMLRGPAHTTVDIEYVPGIGYKDAESSNAEKPSEVMILTMKLKEDYNKLIGREESFATILLKDLASIARAPQARFQYLGMEKRGSNILVSIKIRNDKGGTDIRSGQFVAQIIYDTIYDQSKPIEQYISLGNFRALKYFAAKDYADHQLSNASSYTNETQSRLEAAISAIGGSFSEQNHHREELESRLMPTPTSQKPDFIHVNNTGEDVEFSNRARITASTLHVNRWGEVNMPTLVAEAKDDTHHAILAQSNTVEEAEDESKMPELLTASYDVTVAAQPTHENKPANPSKRSSLEREADSKAPERGSVGNTVLGSHFDFRNLYFRITSIIVGIIAFGLILGSRRNPPPWHWLAWISIGMLGIAPVSDFFAQFFSGGGIGPYEFVSDLLAWRQRLLLRGVPLWWLFMSLNVTNTLGNLFWESETFGYELGAVGSVAQVMYYFGILCMCAILYAMRSHHPYAQSPMSIVNSCFGYHASGLFGAIVMYRLISLVWVSAFTTGYVFYEYNGEIGIFWGGILSGLSPLLYTLMGGMRSLYYPHLVMFFIMWVFLIAVVSKLPVEICYLCSQGTWNIAAGADLIIVRFLQGMLSLPWCTAILTDRLFLTNSLDALLIGGFSMVCAMLNTFLSSLVGVYLRQAGLQSSPFELAGLVGSAYYHLMLGLTITTSIGTMDACLVSAAKLTGLEVFGLLWHREFGATAQPLGPFSRHITRTNVLAGRIAILVVGAIGLCFLSSVIAHPTSITEGSLTGIMAMGLGPPMILLCVWKRKWKRSPLAFILPVTVSFIIGIVKSAWTSCVKTSNGVCTASQSTYPSNWSIGDGPFAYDLGLTVYTFLFCLLASLIGFLADQQFR